MTGFLIAKCGLTLIVGSIPILGIMLAVKKSAEDEGRKSPTADTVGPLFLFVFCVGVLLIFVSAIVTIWE